MDEAEFGQTTNTNWYSAGVVLPVALANILYGNEEPALDVVIDWICLQGRVSWKELQ